MESQNPFVPQVAKQFFPDVAVGYEDPRVTLHIGDGIIKMLFDFDFVPHMNAELFTHCAFELSLNLLFVCRGCIPEECR